jgi:hypothetical protein
MATQSAGVQNRFIVVMGAIEAERMLNFDDIYHRTVYQEFRAVTIRVSQMDVGSWWMNEKFARAIEEDGQYELHASCSQMLASAVKAKLLSVEGIKLDDSWYEEVVMVVMRDGQYLESAFVRRVFETAFPCATFFKADQKGLTPDSPWRAAEEPQPVLPSAEKLLDEPIEVLRMSSRTTNNLKRSENDFVYHLVSQPAETFMKLPNFGEISLKELTDALQVHGLRVGMDHAEIDELYGRTLQGIPSDSFLRRPIAELGDFHKILKDLTVLDVCILPHAWFYQEERARGMSLLEVRNALDNHDLKMYMTPGQLLDWQARQV